MLSTQRDWNPRPLYNKACALPLRYNCCPLIGPKIACFVAVFRLRRSKGALNFRDLDATGIHLFLCSLVKKGLELRVLRTIFDYLPLGPPLLLPPRVPKMALWT